MRYPEARSDTRYVPTPTHVCDVDDFPVPLGDGLVIHVHMESYRGLIRGFSIELRTPVDTVARIDTDHSTVHRHQYYRDGSQDAPPHLIEAIPEGRDGARTVNRMYVEAYDHMYDHAREMLRRWAK